METRVTLNGIAYSDANQMVKNFAANRQSSHLKTSIWLSQTWVKTIAELLYEEGADGFRIYFAKTNDAGAYNNTVVIVSTMTDGSDTSVPSGAVHLDYYTHDSEFLTTDPQARFGPMDYVGSPGATLYNAATNCPPTSCILKRQNDITCENAKLYVANFGSQIQTITNNCVWFSRRFLMSLRDELMVAAHLITNAEPFGIRLYFAEKTEDNTFTIVIVTTHGKNSDGINYDYYECYNTDDYPEHLTGDNAEQCQPNCQGVTMPQ